MKNKIFVHRHHAEMAVHVHHCRWAISSVIVQKDLKDKHVPKMLKNVCRIHVNMVEHALIHMDHTSKFFFIS